MVQTESFLKKHGDELKELLWNEYLYEYSGMNEEDLRKEFTPHLCDGTPRLSSDNTWHYHHEPVRCAGQEKMKGTITVSFHGTPCYMITYESCSSLSGSHYAPFLELYEWVAAGKQIDVNVKPDCNDHYYCSYHTGDLVEFEEYMAMIASGPTGEVGRFEIRYHGRLLWKDSVNVSLRHMSVKDGELERNFLLSLPEEDGDFSRLGATNVLGNRNRFGEYLTHRLEWEKKTPDMSYIHLPRTMYYVLADGKPVGVGTLQRDVGRKVVEYGGNIKLYIAKPYRNRGIGTKALWELGMQMRGYGDVAVIAIVRKDNVAGIKIAEQCEGVLRDKDMTFIESRDPKDVAGELAYYNFPWFCGGG